MQIRQGCGPAGFAFSREGSLREVASAAVGLRPKRSKSNAFYGNAPHRGAVAQRLRGVPIGGSRKYGEKIFTPNGVNLQYFRLEPTSLGSERGEQPLSCNDDDRCLRQKQGGVVGAVASRMQGPLKGRSIRWEPQPVQGRGVSRGREGGVETPLSPSGPAERPRRRCILQKASDLPHATTLCAGSHRQMPLLSPASPLRIFFFCIFLRDFRLIFRWKAVVDSVQFRVILNITTKRFDAEAISNRSPNQRKEPDHP